jgi:hypothetical protein
MSTDLRMTGEPCPHGCGGHGGAHKLTCRALTLPPRQAFTLDQMYGPPTRAGTS